MSGIGSIAGGQGGVKLDGGTTTGQTGDFYGGGGDKFFNFGGGEMPGWMLSFAGTGGQGVAGNQTVQTALLLGITGLALYLVVKKKG